MGGGAKKNGKGARGRDRASGELGRTLMRRAAANTGPAGSGAGFGKHTTDVEPDGKPSLRSVLERNDLDEFLAMAELANRDFTAERRGEAVVVVGEQGEGGGAALGPSRAERTALEDEHRERLKVPRRPPWSPSWTGEQLEQSERAHFLEWRRGLADLEQVGGLVMTPFEKNLEVWRQLWRVLERADLVVQIVDARDPLLYWCGDLETYVGELSEHKRCLLLLNKADLLPLELRRRWAAWMEERGRAYAFFSAQAESEAAAAKPSLMRPGAQLGGAGGARAREEEELPPGDGARLLGRAELAELLEREAAAAAADAEEAGEEGARGAQGRAVAGLVGYPNVGKTSTLNALLGTKKAQASATPGKTKHFQTFNLTEGLQLADCPGLVFPSFSASKEELVAAAVVPIDRLTDVRRPVGLLASRMPRGVLEGVYRISLPQPAAHEDPGRAATAGELLWAYCAARRMTRPGGLPDETRAGRLLLKDYVSGKLNYCFEPPYEGEASERERGFGCAGPDVELKVQHEEGPELVAAGGPVECSPGEALVGDEEELPPDLMAALAVEPGAAEALGMEAAAKAARSASARKRAEHKYNKKPPKVKGRRKEYESAGASYYQGAMMTGKKGGVVPASVQVRAGMEVD